MLYRHVTSTTLNDSRGTDVGSTPIFRVNWGYITHLALSRIYLYGLITVEILKNMYFQKYHEIKITNAVVMIYNTFKTLFLDLVDCN